MMNHQPFYLAKRDGDRRIFRVGRIIDPLKIKDKEDKDSGSVHILYVRKIKDYR